MEPISFQEFVESKSEAERLIILDSVKKSLYARISDSVFFKWQAGEATQEEWAAARQLVISLHQSLVDEHGVPQDLVDYLRQLNQ